MPQPAYTNLVINREYRLVEQIAEGTRGLVFRAEHLSPVSGPRSIGLRLLPADHPAVPSLLERLTALSHLTHPNLVGVHTMGQVRGGMCADSLFYAWDYGDASLAQTGSIPPSDLVQMAADLNQGLQALHDLDLTHRAIRPENVLRVGNRWCLADPQPDITVRDVLWRAAGESDLSWLAPEVLEGEYGPAADLWALGAVVKRAWTGRPGRLSVPAQLAERIDSGPSLPPGTPPPLDVLLHNLSVPDPQRRYTSWQVQALLADQPVPPGPPPPPRKGPPRTGATRRGVGRRLGAWASPGTALTWIGGDLAVGSADGYIALIRPGAPRPHRSARVHHDTVSALRAGGPCLISGGWDGRLVRLDAELSVVSEVDLGSPVLAVSDGHAVTADAPMGPGVSAWVDTDGRLAMGTLYGRIVWADGETLEPWAAVVMGGDQGVSAGWNGSVRVGSETEVVGGSVRCVVSIPDGVVCGLHDGGLLVLRGGSRLRLEGHTGSVRALAADGLRIASAGQDKQVLVWDLSGL